MQIRLTKGTKGVRQAPLGRLAAALVPALVAGLALAAPARADSLADIRSELNQLGSQIQSLKSELVSSNASLQQAGGAGALDRMNTMESELSRLTAQTEQLQNRVNKIVSDGTNRIGDIEFRLCELDSGCDPSKLPDTPTLGGSSSGGGSSAAAAPAAAAPAASATAGLAVNEKNDFDRAKAVLDQGDFRGAADKFATFTQTYPGSSLSGDAAFMRGEALSKLGQTANAARAYLDGFSGDPDGPRAADNLLRLGTALGQLGQTQEACVTLAEVGVRFPGNPAVQNAQDVRSRLKCQ